MRLFWNAKLLCAVIALAIIPSFSCSPAKPLPPLPPGADLLQSQVFFERFLDRYAQSDDLPLLRAGKVRVNHYDPVDVSKFDWTRGTADYTWFMQMQEMRFLLPLIASQRGGDRAIARSWLERWNRAYAGADVPAHKWGEPRTFAYRSMVFVYYLKVERARPDGDADVVALLTELLAAHQKFLKDEVFEGRNNLALIEALGLLETTRVHADAASRQLAFERIELMMRKLVSPLGTELENSPAYHFIVLKWLEEIREYVHDLPGAPHDFVSEVDSVASGMRAAGYFLCDHAGRLAQIGDTDSMVVAADSAAAAPSDTASHFWDRIAGYAVFKGVGRDRRYVVMRIPLPGVRWREHLHSDALGLWYSDDGEVILGDGGRYTYALGPERDYFVSAAAHNTVLPRFAAQERVPSHFYRPVSSARNESNGHRARWWGVIAEVNQRIAREVTIADGSIVVVDSIQARDKRTENAQATVLWNFGGDVDRVALAASNDAGTWSADVVTRRGRHVRVTLKARDSSGTQPRVRVIHGEESPLLAWYAPRWGARRPVWGIEVVIDTRPTAVLETRLTMPAP